MIFSAEQLFSDKQAITASAVSTNHIDLGATGTPARGNAPLVRDIGKGTAVPLTIQVTDTFATLTDLTVQVQVATDAVFTSPKTVHTSTAVPVADLVAGYRFNLDRFQTGTDQRYLRLNYVVGGVSATAGSILAGISMGNQTNT